jgi:hypothetical protein
MNRKARWLQAGTLATLLVTGVLAPTFAASARLGISVRTEDRVLSAKIKERYHVDGGVLVEYVQPDSPADQADIRIGDLIIAFQGHRISDWDALMADLNSSSPGTEVVVGLVRGEMPMNIKVTLATRETGASQAQEPTANSDAGNENAQPDQDNAAAEERSRLQSAEEERQRLERERLEQERQQELQRQQGQFEQDRERTQQLSLMALRLQHEREMLMLNAMPQRPVPQHSGSYSVAQPRYYTGPTRTYPSRGSSAPPTLPQIWHGVLGVGGALLGAGADTLGALIGK